MILSGVARLGRDAEVRYMQDGGAVSNLSLAFNWGKKDGTGNRQTTWVDAALWGKRAEALAEYLTKGTALDVVINDVRVETYDKRDGGGKGFALRGNIQIIEFAGGKREDGGAERTERPASHREPVSEENKGAGSSKFDDLEDDIPFLFNTSAFCDTIGVSKAAARARYGKGLQGVWALKERFGLL